MALSNWDHIAWDKDGKSTMDRIVGGDTKVEIYKNWIYIHHKSLEYPIQMEKGIISIDCFDICVERDDITNAVFLVCRYWDHKKDITSWLYGIGTYGFDDGKWVGVRDSEIERFKKWLKFKKEKDDYAYWIKIPEFKENKRFNQGDMFFADHFGWDKEDLKTDVGKAKGTIFGDILDNCKVVSDKDGNKKTET